MTVANVALDAPSLPFRLRIRQPDALIALILLMWVPLMLYVMFGDYLGLTLK
jgi:hypothetical protein